MQLLSACSLPLLLFHPRPTPAAEGKGSSGSMPSSPRTDPQGGREVRHRTLGAHSWADSQALDGAGLCPSSSSVSAPSALPNQLAAPGHLCHSAPSLCLARSQLGMMRARVCAPLRAASWTWVGVGRTLTVLLAPPMPEAADYALASPNFLPGVS